MAIRQSPRGAGVVGQHGRNQWSDCSRSEQRRRRRQQLSVSAEGSRFTVSLNGSLLFTHQDGTYKSGTLGLRVTDIPTTFSNLRITASP